MTKGDLLLLQSKMHSNSVFIELLKEQLGRQLPGSEAQSKLEPEIRRVLRQKAVSTSQAARESAVLLLLFPKSDQLHLLFIQRAEYDGVHSGQIAFPGGRFENSDITFETTARRETAEETGIPTNEITIIGKLTSLYIPPSNFNVHPFVGFISSEPTFTPDPVEVAKVLPIPVFELQKPEIIQQKTITTSDGYVLDVPCYVYDNHTIWGATSMILSEFLEVVSSAANPESQ